MEYLRIYIGMRNKTVKEIISPNQIFDMIGSITLVFFLFKIIEKEMTSIDRKMFF